MKWHYSKIPKIVHLYWGHPDNHLSYLRYLTPASIRRQNPEWKIVFHVPKIRSKSVVSWKTGEQAKPSLAGKNFLGDLLRLDVEMVEHDFEDYGFDNQAHEVHKSDFLRWKLLAEEGGVWSDMDILYFKPFAELKTDCLNSMIDTGVHIYPSMGLHAIGLLLSGGQNNFFKTCYEVAKKEFTAEHYQSIGSNILNARYPSIFSIKQAHSELIPGNITASSVYQIPSTHIPMLYNQGYQVVFNDDAIGVHYYGGDRLSKYYENRCLDESSILPACIMTNVVNLIR